METTYISSRTNPTVVMLSSLSQKKNRYEAGLYVIEGKKLCLEALGRCSIRYAVLKEGADDTLRHISEDAAKSGASVIVLSESAYMKVSSDPTPDGIMFVSDLPQTDTVPEKDERVVALECVRDPGNVGTILRSAAAFGFDRVILADCADVTNPKTVRASMGALFKLKITVCNTMHDVIPKMKNDGRRIVGAALCENSLVLGKDEIFDSDCTVIGNEGHGLTKETLDECDRVMMVPMSDKTESLNAATAASVILWEYGKTFGTF